MLFDEDATLMSFFSNYTDPEDEDELKAAVVKYVGGGGLGKQEAIEEQETTGESLDDVSAFIIQTH